MLIISVIKGLPETSRINSLVTAVFLIPGLICAPVLATSGVNITIQTTHDTIKDLNSSRVWTDNATNAIQLINPIWVLVHMMIFFVLLIFIIRQLLMFLLAEP